MDTSSIIELQILQYFYLKQLKVATSMTNSCAEDASHKSHTGNEEGTNWRVNSSGDGGGRGGIETEIKADFGERERGQ